tara:strand:- start:1192 stop:1953 length:762 start_codon:yes stop_codon:yes gene_type:complete
MEFITSKSNSVIQAKSTRNGEVRIDHSTNNNFGGKPFICVKARNKWVWKSIIKISGPVWVDLRKQISESIIKTGKHMEKQQRKWERMLIKSDEINNKKNHEIKFLFNKLPDYIKDEYFKKFENPEIKIMHCKVCNEISSLNRRECIDKDCGGMCENCHESWQKGDSVRKGMFVFGSTKNDKHKCPSCNKSQLQECPICYDNKPIREMIKSDTCTHTICCICFSTSFKSHPIVECPMCRSQFNHTLIKSTESVN